MADVNDSIMIALIPNETNWCKIDFPHVTVVYGGKVESAKKFWLNEMAKTVSSLSMITNPLYLKVSGVEIFGEEEKVEVLRLIPTPELLAIRSFLDDWDNGEFPDYKPHATIGPVGSSNFTFEQPMPMALYFDRIVLQWGEINLTFWLRKY